MATKRKRRETFLSWQKAKIRKTAKAGAFKDDVSAPEWVKRLDLLAKKLG